MGVSFAKSIKFGAVRFNLSGSGIGVSVGIPGLRIGTGPRGAYIGGGFAGFRYRQSLGSARGATRAPARALTPNAHPSGTAPGQPGVFDAASANITSSVEHDNKSVLELRDSNSEALLDSISSQSKRTGLWPSATVALCVVFVLAVSNFNMPAIAKAALFAACIALVLWVRWRDKMRRLTVLFYEPDARTSQLFDSLVLAVQVAASSRKLKSVGSTARYGDTKRTAGAALGLKLQDASFTLGQAPGVVANVDVPMLRTGRTTLAFYPDRVLAFQDKSVGAVEYKNLQADSSPSRFIESEALPSDATVVDQTWQYVNKKGGPDKRFKNNRQLPVCRYNELSLTTSSGLDIRFMGSKDGAFDALAAALRATG